VAARPAGRIRRQAGSTSSIDVADSVIASPAATRSRLSLVERVQLGDVAGEVVRERFRSIRIGRGNVP
jgi:hypothetical protein